MSKLSSEPNLSWQTEIQTREEEARVAFLKADLAALDKIFSDSFTVNSPLQRVIEKRELFEALRSGRIRHQTCELEIEHMKQFGDLVVVMGKDRVMDPPDGIISHRRFTNIWKRDRGVWQMIARHAHVVSREADKTQNS